MDEAEKTMRVDAFEQDIPGTHGAIITQLENIPDGTIVFAACMSYLIIGLIVGYMMGYIA